MDLSCRCCDLQVALRLAEPHLYGALCLLVDEAGFLIEPKAAALIEKLPAAESKMVAAQSIVRALGVTDGPAFDALIDALSADSGSGAAYHGVSSLSGKSRSPLMRMHFVQPLVLKMAGEGALLQTDCRDSWCRCDHRPFLLVCARPFLACRLPYDAVVCRNNSAFKLLVIAHNAPPAACREQTTSTSPGSSR